MVPFKRRDRSRKWGRRTPEFGSSSSPAPVAPCHLNGGSFEVRETAPRAGMRRLAFRRLATGDRVAFQLLFSWACVEEAFVYTVGSVVAAFGHPEWGDDRSRQLLKASTGMVAWTLNVRSHC